MSGPRWVPSGQRIANLLLGLSVSSSCSGGTERIDLVWPEGDFAAVWVYVEANGRITERVGPFGLLDRQRIPSEAPLELSVDVDADVVFLGLPRDRLEGRDARLVLDAPEEISLGSGTTSCVEGELLRPANRYRVRLTEVVEPMRWSPGEDRFTPIPVSALPGPSEIAVEIPIDDDRCFSGPAPRWSAFGAASVLLPPDQPVAGELRPGRIEAEDQWRELFGAAWIDRDRVLARSPRAAFIFERGQPFEDAPSHILDSEAALPELGGGGFWIFTHVDAYRSSDITHVVITAESNIPLQSAQGALIQTTIDSAGFTGSSTVTQLELAPGGVLIDNLGRTVVGGRGGRVFLSAVPGASFETFTLSQSLESLIHARAAPSAERPHFLGGKDGAIYWGDFFEAEPNVERIRATARPISGSGFRTNQDGETELIAVEFPAEITRRIPDGTWEDISLDVAGAENECASSPGPCGRRGLANRIPHVFELPHGTLLLVSTECSVSWELDLARRCAEPVGPPDAVFELSDRPRVLGADYVDGRAVVVGADGQVHEVVWE